MFPESLSHNTLSLVCGEPRRALSVFFTVTRDLEITGVSIKPTLIKVTHKLSYDAVDTMLEDGGIHPDLAWLDIVYNFALNQETARLNERGTRVQKQDCEVVVHDDGTLSLKTINEQSPSRSLIAELAVLANGASADFAVAHRFPLVFRGQRASETEDRDALNDIPQGPAYDFALRMKLKKSSTGTRPESHATLGLAAYAQVTSPIRRYFDLINQRQIAHYLNHGAPRYSEHELQEIIESLDRPLARANTVNKETKRFWLLRYLKQRAENNPLITAYVVKIDPKYVLVELDEVFFTSTVKSPSKLRLGDAIKVRIASVVPHREYLKLEVDAGT
jgi:exoribonuclease-2